MEDRSTERFRLQGNEYFRSKQYEDAKNSYQRGAQLDPTDPLFPLNLALVHLKQGDFPRCLTACNTCLRLIEASCDSAQYATQKNKATYRKIQALIGLGDFNEAHELALSSCISDSLAPFPRPDLGQYLQRHPACVENGGGVHVEEAPGMGRILVAKRAYKPGDCVLCDQALLWVDRNHPVDLVRAFLQPFVSAHTSPHNAPAHPMWQLYGLHAAHPSPYTNQLEQAHLVLRTLAQERHPFAASLTAHQIAHLLEVANTNSQNMEAGFGFFALAAMLQHDCDPNCAFTTTRHDAASARCLVHAIRPVQEGDSLSIAYLPCWVPTAKRLTQLESTYGFQCMCALCRGAKPDPYRTFLWPHSPCPQKLLRPHGRGDADQDWRCTKCGAQVPPDQIRLLAEAESALEQRLQQHASDGPALDAVIDRALEAQVVHASHHLLFGALDARLARRLADAKEQTARLVRQMPPDTLERLEAMLGPLEREALRLAVCAEQALGEYCPGKVSCWRALGSVRMMQNDLAGARQAFEKARSIAVVCWGPNSDAVRDLEEQIECTRAN